MEVSSPPRAVTWPSRRSMASRCAGVSSSRFRQTTCSTKRGVIGRSVTPDPLHPEGGVVEHRWTRPGLADRPGPLGSVISRVGASEH